MPAVEVQSPGRSAKFALNVLWNGLGVAAGLAAGLLLSPYLIRKLGPDGYGVWALSFALIEYYWLLDLGFRSATVKFVAHHSALEEHSKVSEVISTALLYSSAAASLIVLGILTLAPVVQRNFQIAPAYVDTFSRLIVIVSMSWALSIVFGIFGAALDSVQRFDLAMRATVAGTLARTAGTFLLLYMGYGLIALGLVAAAGQIVAFVLQYFSFRRVFPGVKIGQRYATFAMFKRMGHFGIHTFFINLSHQFLSQSAPLLIGHFHPAMFVGFYALPVRLLQYTVEMVARIGLVTNSNAAEMSARGDRSSVGALAIYANRYCLILFMPLGVVFITYGRPLFLKWVGPEFARQSAPILPVLLLGSIIAVIGQYSSTMLLQGLARHQIYARGLMMEAVLGVATLWLVIPRYGILGAAWVSSLFMIANRAIFVSWLTGREIGMPFAAFVNIVYTRPLLTAIPTLALSWCLRITILPGVTWLQLAAAGMADVVVYYATAYYWCLPAEHRRMITGGLIRVRGLLLPRA